VRQVCLGKRFAYLRVVLVELKGLLEDADRFGWPFVFGIELAKRQQNAWISG